MLLLLLAGIVVVVVVVVAAAVGSGRSVAIGRSSGRGGGARQILAFDLFEDYSVAVNMLGGSDVSYIQIIDSNAEETNEYMEEASDTCCFLPYVCPVGELMRAAGSR